MENDFIEPYDDPVTVTRNSTELSRFCEKLVITFIKNRATSGKVKVQNCDFEIDVLYQGLRNTCKKNDFKNLVEVHKRYGDLILVRKIKNDPKN